MLHVRHHDLGVFSVGVVPLGLDDRVARHRVVAFPIRAVPLGHLALEHAEPATGDLVEGHEDQLGPAEHADLALCIHPGACRVDRLCGAQVRGGLVARRVDLGEAENRAAAVARRDAGPLTDDLRRAALRTLDGVQLELVHDVVVPRAALGRDRAHIE